MKKIRTRWPREGQICGICFTEAAHTFGRCPLCDRDGILPGRSADGNDICRDCAEIPTNFTCDTCGREAERIRNGSCMVCVLTAELIDLLKPNDPPDLRLHRLVRTLTGVERPESIYTWCRPNTSARDLLRRLGTRELDLSHEAFDREPNSLALEHLRAILVHHGMLPVRDEPHLIAFRSWLATRLESLSPEPEIHSPIEWFAGWHHLRRLETETSETKNMDYATRSAKQEITEAGKFLSWLADTHSRTVATMNQAHVDEYIAEGPSTRKHIRNFLHYLAKERTIHGIDTPARQAKTTPMLTQEQRIEHIRTLMTTVELSVSIRLFGLLFLLYGVPIGKLTMLTVDAVRIDPTGATITLGSQPAPLPDVFIPLLLAHLDGAAGQNTTNTGTNWLFPGSRAGRPRAPFTMIPKLKQIGIEIQGVRNTTLRTLVEELDPTSLSRLIGYSSSTLDRHGTAATVPWSSYVADKNSLLRDDRGATPAPEGQRSP